MGYVHITSVLSVKVKQFNNMLMARVRDFKKKLKKGNHLIMNLKKQKNK